MGYTHHDKLSGKTGLGVGPKGAEIVVANASGNLFQTGVQITPTAAELNKCDGIPATAYQVVCEKRDFTETGAGTYTATVAIPAGSIVQDVVFANRAVWNAVTTAVLNVGDVNDADGYITAVDVKTAPVADVAGAGGISNLKAGTGTGAYKGLFKRYAAAGTITATVVTVGAGTLGRSDLFVFYGTPTSVAATKV